MESKLPEELIDLILLKLPFESLLNFKLASKHWLRHITDKSFAPRKYHNQLPNPTSCPSFLLLRNLLFYNSNVITRISLCEGDHVHSISNLPLILPKPRNKDYARVVFKIGHGIYSIFEHTIWRLMIWNPTTNETKVLPSSPYRPSIFVHVYHFGSLDWNDDGNLIYKVGRITSQFSRGNFYLSLEFYSSDTKTWKFIPSFACRKSLVYDDWILHYANLHGKSHWVIQDETCITIFDYKTAMIGKIKGPSLMEDYWVGRCIVSIFDDEFLCIVISREDKYMDVWVMREYGVENSWTKEYTIGPIPWGMELIGFSSKVQGVFLRSKNKSLQQKLYFFKKSSTVPKVCFMGESMFRYMITEHEESFASLSN